MEKQPYEEFRDNLAEKLKSIRKSEPEKPGVGKARAEGYLQAVKETSNDYDHHKYGHTRDIKLKTQYSEALEKRHHLLETLKKDLAILKSDPIIGKVFSDRELFLKFPDRRRNYYEELNSENFSESEKLNIIENLDEYVYMESRDVELDELINVFRNQERIPKSLFQYVKLNSVLEEKDINQYPELETLSQKLNGGKNVILQKGVRLSIDDNADRLTLTPIPHTAGF